MINIKFFALGGLYGVMRNSPYYCGLLFVFRDRNLHSESGVVHVIAVVCLCKRKQKQSK